MKTIFPKEANSWVLKSVLGLAVVGAVVPVLAWYYLSPRYYEVGYQPTQPVPFSHRLHAGALGLDCRYCHSGVEVSKSATVPSTQTCMTCHTLIRAESEKLAPVRDSWETGTPIQWTKVHDLPDYAHFNHAVHIRAQVGCVSCHGNLTLMEKVTKMEPLNMNWCLNCHRNPGPHLRPASEITNMNWAPGPNHQEEAAEWIKNKAINPPLECSACHY